MERLTKRVGAGEAVPKIDFDICAPFIKSGYCKTGMQKGFPRRWERHCNDTCILGTMIDRLARYEDTGLEPEEIYQLQGEVFGLKIDKKYCAEAEAAPEKGATE